MMLGIPIVLVRLIQQAVYQELGPLFEPGFSACSYGFRPAKSAHQAVQAARDHVAAGLRWVVHIDLAKFFDRVNHDVLMSRVARRSKTSGVCIFFFLLQLNAELSGNVKGVRTFFA